MKITVHIEPMGAPRMTQRDRWAKRPCVLRYHAFKDVLRASAAGFIPNVDHLWRTHAQVVE